MKNDRGFTLIELVVVMAILAVCMGIITASVSTVSYSAAKRCANELDAAISKCRIDAMSRAGSVSLTIYRGSDGSIVAEETENTEGGTTASSDTVGSPRCNVTFETEGALARGLGDAGTDAALYLSFDRETGALRTLQPDGVGEAAQQCSAIHISGGGQTLTIDFFPATGAHTLEG